MSGQRPTIAEVDLAALRHNLAQVRQQAGPSRQVLAVVKADAYGHGAAKVAPVLAAAGADRFGVALVEEGIELRQAGIQQPILVLGGVYAGQEQELLHHRLTPCLFDLELAGRLDRLAAEAGVLCPFHLKVDTGMGRVGFRPEELSAVLAQLARCTSLQLEGVISHLAVADDPAHPFTSEQQRRFRVALDQVRQAGFTPQYIHLSNSAALLGNELAECNLVRAGIVLYGCLPSAPFAERVELRRVLSFRTRIAQLKRVPAGTGVSYGHRFSAERDTLLAALPVGYADGFRRHLSCVGEVLVRGQRAPVAGTVCMDWTLVDVTDLPAVSVGDPVTLLGCDGADCISAEEWAGKIGTISYEVLCGIGKRVPRKYVEGGGDSRCAGRWKLMYTSDLRLALDLGTTTLAGRLLDSLGTVVAEAKQLNPQRTAGADVIRRLEAALAGDGLRLQALLVEGIESLLTELLAQAGCCRSDIGAAAAAANPAISYLLRNLPPGEILFPPHRPRERGGVFLAPAELGLELPVPLYLFPLISGYVGGDLLAFLFAQEQPKANTVFLDVGTNGEMALFDGARWWVTSVAAGPAFEGGGIGSGMLAAPGAVEGVQVQQDRLQLKVIGGGPPRGLCGSGLVEAIAAGLVGGLIDRSGRIVEPGEVAGNLARYLTATSTGRALRLYRDAAGEVLLSQDDVRSFQLAKGAVRAGVECLLRRAGVSDEAVAAVVVTGAFGLALPPQLLKKVAMLPPTMIEKVRFVPGGALAGVGRFLGESDGGRQLELLAAQLQAYPLSGTPHFEQAFLHSLEF